jgi:hypothetical protein
MNIFPKIAFLSAVLYLAAIIWIASLGSVNIFKAIAGNLVAKE